MNTTAVQRQPSRATDFRSLLIIAGAVALLHIATNNQYGFHRDELQVLSDARHMDWGFVAYPPFTPFIERISMAVFGLWMPGLRLASVLFQATAIVMAGVMASEFGGGRMAQIASALAVALSPLPIFSATEFQYTSFEYLWWVLACYCVVRLLNSEDPRWWIGIGACIGLGLETKYTTAFFTVGVAVAVLLTPQRRWLANKWFWMGVGVALLIFLPNLVWQIRHDFISYRFLHHIHARDVRLGRTKGFLLQQLWLCTNPLAPWLWIPGVIWAFRQRRYRMLGWMYLVPLVLFVLGKGRGYYFSAVYPVFIAAGAAAAERWLSTLRHEVARALEIAWFAALALAGMFFLVLLMPVLPLKQGGTWAMGINGDLREEIGWSDLVDEVARIRDSLPLEQRQNVGIFTSNYGERGAIAILGKSRGLPASINPTNSAWYWGYGNAPSTVIVIGQDRDDANDIFRDCKLAGHNGNRYGINNEESEDHPNIFVCGAPKDGWAEFWRKNQWFG